MTQVPRLVILGRDGVINAVVPGGVTTPAQWAPLPGSLEAITRLNHAGALVAIVCNQTGIREGLLSRSDLNRIHAKLHDTLARVGGHIDGIFFCPHEPNDACDCHKPAPGLLQAISQRLRTPLAGVPVIGDSRCDVDAALAAAAQPMLVRTGDGQQTLSQHPDLHEIPCFDDLAAVVDALLAPAQSHG